MDKIILEVIDTLKSIESLELLDKSCYIQQGDYSIEVTPQYYGFSILICDQNGNYVASYLTDDLQHEQDLDLDISLIDCSNSLRSTLWNAFEEFCKRFGLAK